MGEARRQRSERHQRLALAGVRLHPANRPDVPSDEVHAEREPLAGQRPEGVGLQREHPPIAVAAPRGEVAPEVVPRGEPSGPVPGKGQPAHHGVLGADVPQQGDRALQEHPPEDRRLALAPELLALTEGADLALPGQPGQLVVGQGVEQRYAAQLRRVHRSLHQVVARYRWTR